MIDIRDLYERDYIGKEITISGWIRNHRKQAHFGFIDLSDGTYFKNLQVVYDDKLKKFDEITIDSPVTFLVGENGIGKSTLVEAIAISLGLNPEGGTQNFQFQTNNTHSNLSNYLNIPRYNKPKTSSFGS